MSCHPATGAAHTRVIEARGVDCRHRRHEVGLRLFLWDLLPEPKRHREPFELRDANR